ncbi:MAG: thiamine pyrophosphate-binding protein [Chloroflexi bacterium]|nr:thiamine pyrophosphate-binding protein [Chloroflexota bacterium]
MPRMTGGEALVRTLVRAGVEVIFGLPGVQMYGLTVAIRDEPGIRMITPRSEFALTYMADGYSRVGNRIAPVMVVPGPGVYNASGGLATAYSVSSRVLLIAGQTPRDTIGGNTGALHEVNDQRDTIKPITKWQGRALHVRDVPGIVAEAVRQLNSGRPRPVYIDLPPEAMLELDDVEIPEHAPVERITPPDSDIEAAAKLIAGASNPMIYAGSGVHLSAAHDELRSLAETYNLPVRTSRGGKGTISADHPLHLGAVSPAWLRDGGFPDPDVVLAVGTRAATALFEGSTQVLQIDVDPDEIGRFHKNTIPLIGDAKSTLAKLHDAMADTDAADRHSPEEAVRGVTEFLKGPDLRTEPQDSFNNAIREAVPDDGIAIYGMTQLGYYGRPFYPARKPRTFIDSGYSGNLGFAYPTALGAKVAAPDVPVVCVSGDGGFGYQSPEMATAMKYGINVVLVVFNDNAFGNVARDLDAEFGGQYEADLHNPDYVRLAKAYGLESTQVKEPTDLVVAIKDMIDRDAPALIEVPVGRMPRQAGMTQRPAWATPHK